jgi:hypothetical protein
MEHQDAPEPSEPEQASGSSGASFEAVSRATGLALGVLAAALGAAGEGLAHLGTEEPAPATGSSSEEPARTGELVDQATHAAVGAGAAAAGRALALASAAATSLARAAEAFLRQPLVRDSVDQLTTATGAWEERGRETLDVDSQAAVDAGLDLAAEIARRVVERLDLNEIVDRVDIDRAVSRLDVDRLVQRLDLTRIAQGVLDQLDLTAIARRVIDELDLTEIARRVIDELELTELIRESTTTVSVDTVDAIRVGGMNADRALARLVDRVLMRGNGSASDGGEEPSDPAGS